MIAIDVVGDHCGGIGVETFGIFTQHRFITHSVLFSSGK